MIHKKISFFLWTQISQRQIVVQKSKNYCFKAEESGWITFSIVRVPKKFFSSLLKILKKTKNFDNFCLALFLRFTSSVLSKKILSNKTHKLVTSSFGSLFFFTLWLFFTKLQLFKYRWWNVTVPSCKIQCWRRCYKNFEKLIFWFECIFFIDGWVEKHAATSFYSTRVNTLFTVIIKIPYPLEIEQR